VPRLLSPFYSEQLRVERRRRVEIADLCLAKTTSDEKLNRSPDVLTVKSRLDPPDSC
jgi:hypothetical protein